MCKLLYDISHNAFVNVKLSVFAGLYKLLKSRILYFITFVLILLYDVIIIMHMHMHRSCETS